MMKIFPKLLRVPCAYAPLGLVSIALLLSAACSFADYPQWWIDRGVINTNMVATNDYAAANQGQLKHIATASYDEFASKLSGLDLSMISNMVSGFSSSNNYAAINLGQLKYVAGTFYNVLWDNDQTNAWPVGMTAGPYPWSAGTSNANDFALVNLGQLKYTFSFELAGLFPDSDGDGMPDWWEIQYGLNLSTNDASWDADNDGLMNGEEYFYTTDPLLWDTDGDLLVDGNEVSAYGTSPIKQDTDGDTLNDAEDIFTAAGINDTRSALYLSLHASPSFHVDLSNTDLTQSYEFYFSSYLASIPDKTPWIVADPGMSGTTIHWYDIWTGPGRDLSSAFYRAGVSTDTDEDGVSDGYEVVMLKTSPGKKNTDELGANDGDEDFDGDGLTNREEYHGTVHGGSSSPWHPDTDGDGISDGPIVPSPYNLTEGPDAFPLDPAGSVDTDNDGMPNKLHGTSNSNPPLIEDSDDDGDGVLDINDDDDDGDGLPDMWETDNGLDPNSDLGVSGAIGDVDNDGFSNLEELLNGTDPMVADSNSNTGTVATIRYYYDEDDRLTDFYSSSEVAQKTSLSVSHNISEEMSAQ